MLQPRQGTAQGAARAAAQVVELTEAACAFLAAAFQPCQGVVQGVFRVLPPQVVELTEAARAFLAAAFQRADRDADGALTPGEVDELFSTAPAACVAPPRPRQAVPHSPAHGGAVRPGAMLLLRSLWPAASLVASGRLTGDRARRASQAARQGGREAAGTRRARPRRRPASDG